MRLTRRCASIALLGGILTLTVVWWQWYGRVLHPHPLILGVPFLVMVVAAIVCLVTGLWRVVRGPRRLPALFWSSTALLPLLCWTALGLYALSRSRDRQVPGNLPMDLTKIAAASLLRAEVAVRNRAGWRRSGWSCATRRWSIPGRMPRRWRGTWHGWRRCWAGPCGRGSCGCAGRRS